MSSATLTLRLDRLTSRRLARLASSTDRTRSRLAAEAITRYLDEQAWQVEAIEEGVRAADAGELVTHAEVVRRVSGWAKASRRA
jgi:RHH-type transcriptional regulator, rel operon repressor / antitoxin RelB